VIEAAFYRALERYQVEPRPFDVKLFRPRLRPVHTFGGGGMINSDRRRIYHDNGWGRFVRSVEVFEMPGDHDNMVLEPNVRILATNLRRCIEAARLAIRRASEPPPDARAAGATKETGARGAPASP
jgi:thioesterase domain-containing protein